MAEINLRVTGDPELTPLDHFVGNYCDPPRRRALSFGVGEARLERNLLARGACERIVGVDLSSERLAAAAAQVPGDLADRLELVCANFETWRPEGTFDLIVAKGALHHVHDLERMFDLFDEILDPDGVLYVDEFVGPSRFQWTDKQLAIVNRLLGRLSPERRADLVEPKRGARPIAARPSVAAMIDADPSEAARSGEILGFLRSRLEPVEEREGGGAVFHLLFSRIMGNFHDADDLVRVLMEVDRILTEERIIDTDYLWGVYRRPSRTRPTSVVATSQARPRTGTAGAIDGRVEGAIGGRLYGWIVAPDEPDAALSVDLYVDNKLVAKAVADRPRPDVVDAGYGTGGHGFAIELPRHVLDGNRHYVDVLHARRHRTVPFSAAWSTNNVSHPDATTFEAMRRDAPPSDLPGPRVLTGRDGWGFLCDDTHGNLDQLTGALRLTGPDLADYRGILEARHASLAALGVPYLFAVAPSKEAVYPERLPPAPQLDAPRTARQLLDAMAGSPVPIVDLHATIRGAGRLGIDLYYAHDTHWNYDGALVAASALLDGLREIGLDVVTPATEEISWEAERIEGDLAGKPAVRLVDGRLHTDDGAPAGVAEPPASRRPSLESLGVRTAELADHLRVSETRPSVALEGTRRPAAPRAVVYGDSFARWLMPYLGSAFSRSAWLWTPTIDVDVVRRERPAVVVQIVAERFLPRVPYGDRLQEPPQGPFGV